jgi:type IV secretion system protein VirD4
MFSDRSSARFLNTEELQEKHAYKSGAFFVGRCPKTGGMRGAYSKAHVAVFAGTRGGKGSTLIIPNLLLWAGSAVCIDPKGENASVTLAGWGAGSKYCHGQGKKGYAWDPYHIGTFPDKHRVSFNPLDLIDPYAPNCVSSCRILVNAMAEYSENPYWNNTFTGLTTALILHVLTAPHFEGKRNLITVRNLAAKGDIELLEALEESGLLEQSIKEAKEKGKEIPPELYTPFGMLLHGMAKNPACNEAIQKSGSEYTELFLYNPETFSNVLSNLNTRLSFLDDLAIQNSIQTTSFNIDELKTDPDGIRLFFCLPFEEQRLVHYPLVKMFLTFIFRRLRELKNVSTNLNPVLMIIDEMPSLKTMPELVTASSESASSGIKLVFICQNISQLKNLYKEDSDTILNNCDTHLFFGCNNSEYAEHISKMLGMKHYKNVTFNVKPEFGKQQHQTQPQPDKTKPPATPFMPTMDVQSVAASLGVGINESMERGYLLEPHQVMQLFSSSQEETIMVHEGYPSIIKRSSYYKDPTFIGLYDASNESATPKPDPLYVKTKLTAPALDQFQTLFEKPVTTLKKWYKPQSGDLYEIGELICELNELSPSLQEISGFSGGTLPLIAPCRLRVSVRILEGSPVYPDMPLCSIEYSRRDYAKAMQVANAPSPLNTLLTLANHHALERSKGKSRSVILYGILILLGIIWVVYPYFTPS